MCRGTPPPVYIDSAPKWASNETAQGFQRDEKGYKYPQRPTKPRYCYIIFSGCGWANMKEAAK